MNAEQIEHELNNRKGAVVKVVRPGFGTQSDSWEGILTVNNRDDYPIIFQVQAPKGATIFCADDVATVDVVLSIPDCIIRLKGPYDYRNRLAHVTA